MLRSKVAVKALGIGKHRLMAGNAVKNRGKIPMDLAAEVCRFMRWEEELGRKIERAGVYIKNKEIFETGCCLINCPQ